jgi:hypothetical protein
MRAISASVACECTKGNARGLPAARPARDDLQALRIGKYTQMFCHSELVGPQSRQVEARAVEYQRQGWYVRERVGKHYQLWTFTQ